MPFVIIALIVALAGGGGAVYAAQEATPGDGLYAVKTLAEQVELALPSSAEAKADRYIAQAGKRVDEMDRVADPLILANLSERYAAALAAASDLLAQVDASKREGATVATYLESVMAKHGTRLAAREKRLPEPARKGLGEASAPATNGLFAMAASERGRGGEKDSDGVHSSEAITETNWYSHTLAAVQSVTGTLGVTLTSTLSNVVTLEQDPQVPGESFRGLASKLRAAAEAIDRGQPAVAAHQLDAFAHQLDAMHRSNHIGDGVYNSLRAQYERLEQALETLSTASTNEDKSGIDEGDAGEQDKNQGHGPKNKPGFGSTSSPPGRGRR